MEALQDQTDDAARWKGKYLSGLDELERREKEWAQLEDLLRQAIGRLATVGYGFAPELDRKLDRLRDGVRKGRNGTKLDSLILDLRETAATLRDTERSARLTPARRLAAFLDTLKLPAAQRRRARKLRQRLEGASGDYDVEPLLDELIDLLHGVMAAGAATSDGSDPAGGGFLSKLLGGSRSTPGAVIHAEAGATVVRLLEYCDLPDAHQLRRKALQARAAGRHTPPETDQLLQDVAAFLSDAVRGKGDEASPEAPVPPLNEVLLQLLEKLDIPDRLQAGLEDIKASLIQEVELARLPLVLDSMAALVAELRRGAQKEKQEIEAFLQSVSDRLLRLDDSLKVAETARRESLDDGRLLDRTVREQVDHMRTSVAGAIDLVQLKASVETGLSTVQGHMAAYMQAQEQRGDEAQVRILELGQRVRELESETSTLRGRISAERALALLDALTQLPNRMAYDERMAQEFAHWKRYGDPLSLVVVDVDRFKSLNDTFGHQAGDKALKALAGRLREAVREADFVARFGGEEFVLLLPKTAANAAAQVAEKLRNDIASAPFHYRNEPVPVTVSCGVAEFRDQDTPESVFERADQALYRAKHEGRNQCRMELVPSESVGDLR